jgi:cytochrome P450
LIQTDKGNTSVQRPALDSGAGPVTWIEESGGYWHAQRYDDVRNIMSDSARFSSRETEIPRPEFAVPAPPIPFNLDPPYHGEIRRVLGPLFHDTRIAPLGRVVRSAARDILGRLSEHDEIEILNDFAIPVVASALWHFLGLVGLGEEDFILKSEDLVRNLADPLGASDWRRLAPRDNSSAHTREQSYSAPSVGVRPKLEEWLRDCIAGRDWNDGGVLDALDHAEWHMYFAEKISEVSNIVVGIVATGLNNTVTVLINAVEHLGRRPHLLRQLAQEPDVIPLVAEELLRLYPPLSPGRVVRRDTRIGGVHLRVGDSVLASIQHANRDDRIFKRADEVILGSGSPRHLSFGMGRHHCLGASFARMVLVTSLREISSAMPHYVISGWSDSIGGSVQHAPLKRLWLSGGEQ